MSSNSSSEEKPATQAELKQDARDARLGSVRKTVEENLRKQMQNDIRQKYCKEETVAFGKCAQESGLWVIFKCKELSNTSTLFHYLTHETMHFIYSYLSLLMIVVNRCMDRYYTEETFQAHFARLKEEGKVPIPGANKAK